MATFMVLSDGTALVTLSGYLESTAQYPNVISLLRFSFTESGWGLAILVFAFAPSLAALIVASLQSRPALGQLLSRLRPIGPDGPAPAAAATYGCLAATYLLVLALYLGVSFVWGDGENFNRNVQSLKGPGLMMFAWVVIAPFLDEGGALEELGWRGFVQPLALQLARSPLRAAVWVGTLWWAWHLPRELPTLLSGIGLLEWAQLQALFWALCIAESLICMLVVTLCGGSVLPAILVHGGSNVWSKAAAADMASLTGIDVRSALLIAIALFIVWRFGPQLGASARDIDPT
jgi:hypothetical protein